MCYVWQLLLKGQKAAEKNLSPTPVLFHYYFLRLLQFLFLFTRLTLSYPFPHTFLNLAINTHYQIQTGSFTYKLTYSLTEHTYTFLYPLIFINITLRWKREILVSKRTGFWQRLRVGRFLHKRNRNAKAKRIRG